MLYLLIAVAFVIGFGVGWKLKSRPNEPVFISKKTGPIKWSEVVPESKWILSSLGVITITDVCADGYHFTDIGVKGTHIMYKTASGKTYGIQKDKFLEAASRVDSVAHVDKELLSLKEEFEDFKKVKRELNSIGS